MRPLRARAALLLALLPLSALGCSSATGGATSPTPDASPDAPSIDAAEDSTIVQPVDASFSLDATDSASPDQGDDAPQDAGLDAPLAPDAVSDANPESGTTHWYPLLSGNVYLNDIVVGPDKNLWFTEQGPNTDGGLWTSVLGTITTAGKITEHALPAVNVEPVGLVTGPDGAFWIVEQAPHPSDGGAAMSSIGRFALDGGSTQYPLPNAGLEPLWITADPDGNLWFSIYNNGATLTPTGFIGRITPAGAITLYPLPTARVPHRLSVGPDGNIWFAESGAQLVDGGLGPGAIGRITTAGVITEFPTPSAASALGIAVGPDGNLWFTEPSGLGLPDGGTASGAVGKATTAGVVTEFPDSVPGSKPLLLTAGPDGNLWITDPGVNTLLKLTTAGVVTQEMILPGSSNLRGIVTGPDGNLWFTDWRAIDSYTP